MMNKWTLVAVGAALATLAGCAAVVATPDADHERAAQQIIRTSFQARGQAQLDRLQQDDVNRECSQAQGAALPDDRRAAIEAANLKAIRWPADGRFLGNWREGEKLAQSGRGMTWTDTAGANGGNCYNCHQISKTEISFGTIGPSLYNYGKLRGVGDPASPTAKPIVEYTWGKIWNAKAYNACSSMPRMGHAGVLSVDQVRDLMALLLDPKSPVNQ
jgi:sulfur-oxidizing protein SoxX